MVHDTDDLEYDAVECPSYEDVCASKPDYARSVKIQYDEQDAVRGKAILQRHGKRILVQNPPAKPLTTEEMDHVYALPYMRNYHPSYEALGGVQDSVSGEPGTAANGGADSKDALSQFGRDLTAAAKEGKLDPVIGRSKEIQRVIQILSRRTKNNPALIGDPGVGKTAVVEGLAQKIVSGDVPETLKGKRLISLDLTGMIAGTKYRGEFEERIKKCIKEVKDAGDIILFIDEMHMLMGAGAAEGAADAANILKPALSRGEVQVIGATTLDEYRKNIEKDAALERRFQPVQINEPSAEDAVEILKGLRDKYEAHHRI